MAAFLAASLAALAALAATDAATFLAARASASFFALAATNSATLREAFFAAADILAADAFDFAAEVFLVVFDFDFLAGDFLAGDFFEVVFLEAAFFFGAVFFRFAAGFFAVEEAPLFLEFFLVSAAFFFIFVSYCFLYFSSTLAISLMVFDALGFFRCNILVISARTCGI